MSSVIIAGDTSGTVTLQAPAVAGTTTLTLPATSGTVLTQNPSAPANSLVVDSSGNVGIGTASPGYKLDVIGQSSLNGIRIGLNGDTINASNSLLAFQVNASERMRIDASGNVLVGTTSIVGSDSPKISVSGGCCIATNTLTTSLTAAIGFHNPNGRIGYIGVSGTTTSYVTSSDYRLKENIELMTGALDIVAQLKPSTYKWKSDGSDGQGFIAHELAEVMPDCVTGEKDAVDADGNPQYQGIDTSFLVATLTAAIQEQQELIKQLQADVAALKGVA